MDVSLALLLAFIFGFCALLGAVFSKILADEFKAWAPWLVARIIAFAAMQMPKDERERVREEWSAWVRDVPGDLGKIFAAIGFVWGAVRIAGSIFAYLRRFWRFAIENGVVIIAGFMGMAWGVGHALTGLSDTQIFSLILFAFGGLFGALFAHRKRSEFRKNRRRRQ